MGMCLKASLRSSLTRREPQPEEDTRQTALSKDLYLIDLSESGIPSFMESPSGQERWLMSCHMMLQLHVMVPRGDNWKSKRGGDSKGPRAPCFASRVSIAKETAAGASKADLRLQQD